jgi:hypothetical protein
MNKKGATFGSWIETLLIICLVGGSLALIGAGMNSMYGQNKDITYGIVTNDTLTQINSYQTSMQNDTTQGQSSISDFGIFKLATGARLITLSLTLIWDFVSGNFINNIVNLMNLGDYSTILIVVLKAIYFITIGFILLRFVTKINI